MTEQNKSGKEALVKVMTRRNLLRPPSQVSGLLPWWYSCKHICRRHFAAANMDCGFGHLGENSLSADS
jgi:hypothetical protein